MLSAFILATHSYSALHLAAQQIHQRCVRPGPLVLRSCPLNILTPITDRDRTVLRRSEPSSRATLIGEQPNPWDLLQPQEGPKGSAVRRLKWHVNWVQNVARQFGPYL